MDIANILATPEGKTLEFKRDLSSHRPVLRTVVAFANTAGGTLVFGVEDSRDICGIDDPLALEERLANLLSDEVLPRVVPEIDLLPWRGTTLVAVTIHPGPSRPYHVSAEGPDHGVYVRVGSTNRRTDAEMRAEIARSARGESFDEQLMPELDSEAVDFAAASESFEMVRTLRRRDMESLRLLVRHGGRLVPTAGGVLLFGRERTAVFPDAWLQAGRFKGANRTHIIDSSRIDLSLPETVDAALAFVKRNVALRYNVAGARRSESWQYPLVAVREAVINALVHADYSQMGAPVRLSVFDDRLEVENPGLLVPGLTIPDILRGTSRARNRVIARVFGELGLIEQWGSGVGRIIDACRGAGLPDPVFEEIGTRFKVTIHAAQAGPARLDEVESRIAEALGESEEGLSTAQVAQAVGRTTRATRTRLKRLVEEGVVVEVGTSPNDPLRRYLLAEERGRYGR